jgi:hypothetical protein
LPQHDAAVSVVDPHRTQVPVAGLLDPFVIDAGGRRIFPEFLYEARHLGLLRPGQSGEGREEIGRDRDGKNALEHRSVTTRKTFRGS